MTTKSNGTGGSPVPNQSVTEDKGKADKRPVAYSYIRWSAAQQSKGASLSRQLDQFKEICQTKGWTPDYTLTPDMGISAWKGNNWEKGSLGHFMAMANDHRLPPSSILVIETLDRFSRKKLG